MSSGEPSEESSEEPYLLSWVCPKCDSPVPLSSSMCPKCGYPFHTLWDKDLGSVVTASGGTIDLFSDASKTLSKVPQPTLGELELEDFKVRLTAFENEMKKIRVEYESIEPIVRIPKAFREELAQIHSKLEELEQPDRTPEIEELQETVGALEKFLTLDTANLPVPLFYERLTTQILSLQKEMTIRLEAFSEVKEAYQSTFSQLSGFLKWIKFAMVFVPVAVIIAPIIELLIRHWSGIP